MSDEDLKSYIKSYYLDRKMTYTKLDKHDRAIGVLLEENKQLNSILIELEEYIKKHIEEWENDEDEYLNGVVAEDKDILNKLKEKYK